MTSSTGSGGNSGGGGTKPGSPAAPRQINEFNKRCVALVIDVGAAYFLSIAVTFVCGVLLAPFVLVQRILSHTTVMVIYLLIRDYLFAGRGIGKNMMGLQVIDARTKLPIRLSQSVMRNITWLLPFVVLAITDSAALFIPLPWLNETISVIVHSLGAVYCLLVFPLEAYRLYYRADHGRIGDQLAGTKVVEADMDFSRIIPRQG